MGVGAQSYYRYLTEPVTLKEPRITGYYLRPEMTPTRVNIADMLNGPGNYKITFKMNSGGCSIRNPRFMRGTRVVSELPRDQQDKNGRNSPCASPARKNRTWSSTARATAGLTWTATSSSPRNKNHGNHCLATQPGSTIEKGGILHRECRLLFPALEKMPRK